MEKALQCSEHARDHNSKNKGKIMGFFDFLSANKGQPVTGQDISDEDVQKYLSMAVTFSSAYSLEMFAATKRLAGELTPEEEVVIDLGGYLMFVDAFASADILTRVGASPRAFSEEELDAAAEHTNTVTAGALKYANAFLGQQETSTEGLAEKFLNKEWQEYFSRVFKNCMEGFFAITAVLNPQYKIPNYTLLYRVVEGALARIYGKSFREGLTPFQLCHPMYSKYIQAYFYPLRVSEEEVLSFTYRIYRDLFGEVFGFMACARRKMTELFTADEHMSSRYEQGVVSSYLQVLEDREKEVFSMCIKDRGVPLSDLNVGFWDRKKIFRIPAPTVKDMGNMALQRFLDGFTGKK